MFFFLNLLASILTVQSEIGNIQFTLKTVSYLICLMSVKGLKSENNPDFQIY